MKNGLKFASVLFLLDALGIIIASFFLFLKDLQEPNLFYLNMVVSCLIVIILYIRAFDIFGTLEKVAESSSGYGLKWYGVWVYLPLAIALIVCSIVLEIPFNYCLIGHIILLFILLSFFFMGSVVKQNVNRAIGTIEARKAGLKEINTQIDILEMHAKLGNSPASLESIAKLKENVRFITASDSPAAVSLEEKLLQKILLIDSQIEHNSQTADVLDAEFKECMSIIELRKKQF